MTFTLTVLGTAAAVPTKNRYMSAQYLQIGNEHLLVDCAEGTQFQLLNLGIKFHKINHVLISHLHGDHFYGLPGLLSTFQLQGRKKSLHIHAPEGLQDALSSLLRYSRSFFSFPIHFSPYPSNTIEVIMDLPQFEVSSFPLVHRIPCFGFRFQEKENLRTLLPEKLPKEMPYQLFYRLKQGKDVEFDGRIWKSEEVTLPPSRPRAFAYCTDTLYAEQIIPYIKEVDLLYHEATFLHRDLEKARSTFHTTAQEAAILASKAKAKKLLLGHFSNRYASLDPFLEEAETIFSNTFLAEEGTEHELKS